MIGYIFLNIFFSNIVVADMDISFYIESFSLDPYEDPMDFASLSNSSYDTDSFSDYSESAYLTEVLPTVNDCLGLSYTRSSLQ